MRKQVQNVVPTPFQFGLRLPDRGFMFSFLFFLLIDPEYKLLFPLPAHHTFQLVRAT